MAKNKSVNKSAKQDQSTPETATTIADEDQTTTPKQNTKPKKNKKQKQTSAKEQTENKTNDPEKFERPEDYQKPPELKFYADLITFNVLSRYDPSLTRLMKYTSHCKVYNMCEGVDEEDKINYEGILAIYSRTPTAEVPFTAGLMVLNKASPQNFAVGLRPNKDPENREFFLSEQEGMLFLRLEDGSVYGFWILEEEDRTQIYNWIKSFIDPEEVQSLLSENSANESSSAVEA